MNARPFTLPAPATREDCEAYVYLCGRLDVWEAWARAKREHPRAPATAIAILVRLRGTPIACEHARAIARIYRATEAQKAAA